MVKQFPLPSWRPILLLLAAGLALVQTAHAQFRYSLSAGPNFTSMEVDLQDLEGFQNLPAVQSLDYEMELGFYASLGVGLDLGLLSLHSGLSFINAGAIFDGTDFLERDNFDVNFLSIPADLRITLPIGSSIQPYLLGGGEMRYRLDLSEDNITFEDNLKRQSTAASIGAGIRLNVPQFGISISPEVRYAIDIDGLTEGSVSLGEEVLRIRDEFKADMLRFGLVFGL